MLERVSPGREEGARARVDAPGLADAHETHRRVYGRTMGVMPAREANQVVDPDVRRPAEEGLDRQHAEQEPDLAWRRIVPGRDAWSPHPEHASRAAAEDESWLGSWEDDEAQRLRQRVEQLERRLRRRTVALSGALVVSTGMAVAAGVFAAGARSGPELWPPSWTTRPPAEAPAGSPGTVGQPSWVGLEDEPLTAAREVAQGRSEPAPDGPRSEAVQPPRAATTAREGEGSPAPQPAEEAQMQARVLREAEVAIEAIMRATVPGPTDEEPAFAVAARAEPSDSTPGTQARAASIWPRAEAADGAGAGAATRYATTLPAALRADARSEARILAVLSAGDIVCLVERKGEWLQVEFSDGEATTVSGYVLGKYLRSADEPSLAGSAGPQ